ncbi:hypothetical protein GCM10022252_63980 [Streptosporangium oxazolinicum]|uniref:Uncharacterized protein n=1 Tax=Streptosporangium oxazolinicum TaxID=909287 RepID=A0ABP8BE92_9ACTN
MNDRVALFEPGPHGLRVADIGTVQGNLPRHPDGGQHLARFLRIAYEKKRLMPVGEKRGDRMRADET